AVARPPPSRPRRHLDHRDRPEQESRPVATRKDHTMSLRIARPTSRTAVLLAGLCLLAGIARAGEITTNLTGKVVSINATGNPDAVSQLAALGVHVGSKVTGSITIESTTPGLLVQGPPYEFMQYNNAITDFALAAGSWQLDFVAPPGFTVDFVTVA